MRNPHGFGFAIIAGDKIISERTMSAKRSIARFLMFRRMYPDSYAIWHSRIATHGVKNESNCHPFPVGNDGLTYLAHNGVLDVDQPKGDKRSDSRVFAEEVLPSIGGVSMLDNGTVWNMVSKWASGSKLAILTLDPKAKHNLYIINESAGSWDDNHVWWSNTHHRPSKVYDWSGGWRSHESSTRETMTKVISVLNHDTGIWEAPPQRGTYYRRWVSGDVWDKDTQQFQTPAVGTKVETTPTPKQTGLVVVPKQEDAIDALNGEKEDDDAPMFVECPTCSQETDVNEDPDFCQHCNTCFACGERRLACMCYIPGASWYGHMGIGY